MTGMATDHLKTGFEQHSTQTQLKDHFSLVQVWQFLAALAAQFPTFVVAPTWVVVKSVPVDCYLVEIRFDEVLLYGPAVLND